VKQTAFMSRARYVSAHVAGAAERPGQGLASMNSKSCGTFDCLLWV
jgi:hypothetical protein